MPRGHHRDTGRDSGPSQRALRAGEVIRHAIAEIAPNEMTRRRMLVDNPAELFGFAKPS